MWHPQAVRNVAKRKKTRSLYTCSILLHFSPEEPCMCEDCSGLLTLKLLKIIIYDFWDQYVWSFLHYGFLLVGWNCLVPSQDSSIWAWCSLKVYTVNFESVITVMFYFVNLYTNSVYSHIFVFKLADDPGIIREKTYAALYHFSNIFETVSLIASHLKEGLNLMKMLAKLVIRKGCQMTSILNQSSPVLYNFVENLISFLSFLLFSLFLLFFLFTNLI